MNQQQRREYWQVFNSFQQSREKKYAPAIARALNKQKAEFISQYKQGNTSIHVLHPGHLQTVIRDLYFDAAVVFGAKVRAAIERERTRVVLKHRNFTYGQKARMPIGFNARMQMLIEQYYGLDFLNQSLDITETTRDILQRVLIRAQAEGKGFDDIVKQLEDTELSKSRSRLIARTETVTAANSGSQMASKESGILVRKGWLAAQDNRTRRDHYSVSSEFIDVDAAFEVGGYQMVHPGVRKQPNGMPVASKEVCNCRCCLIHEPVRNAAGRVLSA